MGRFGPPLLCFVFVFFVFSSLPLVGGSVSFCFVVVGVAWHGSLVLLLTKAFL